MENDLTTSTHFLLKKKGKKRKKRKDNPCQPKRTNLRREKRIDEVHNR